MSPRLPLLLALSAATTAALLSAPSPARACGGFFCSIQTPVDQVAERILFTVEGEHVEAHIQIQYAGPSEDFSWVLPLPSQPEIGVGTDLLFTALRAQTDPQFRVAWDNQPGCNYQSNCGCWLADADGIPEASPAGEGPVTVIAEGDVGPYAYKVVESGDGPALFKWLNDNGYDQPQQAQALIEHYAGKGMVFLAIKLLKDKDAGDIQPVVLSWDGEIGACIPLRLTSIAAAANMPIFSWVLAKSRAVPLNFFHVVLNAKAFDWLNCGTEENGFGCGFFGQQQQCQTAYMDLVTGAANTANGHGFVTEYAGSTAIMEQMLYRDGQYDLEKLASQKTAPAFLQEMLNQGFPRNGQVQNLIRDHIPMPDASVLPEDCRGESSFYATWNIEHCIQYMPEGWTFDAEGFAADLETTLIAPLQHAQALFSKFPYMTRLFTTISPEEMTKDPIFSFNPDLPDVANIHTVQASASCDADKPWIATSVALTFEDGTTQTFDGPFESCQPVPSTPTGLPPAVEIQVLGESGPPTVVATSDVARVDRSLDDRGASPGAPNRPPVEGRNVDPIPNTGTFGLPRAQGPTPSTSAVSGGGCGAAEGALPAWAAVLALAFAALWRRRERA
ncbi:MAG: DUF2330 domain-containing protein [Deltaproteobacteria bacterium]|nr:DUF2330 domain-containing protein [Deltaproteobacteria bacterium]